MILQSIKQTPRISIITISFNSENTIKDTLRSVRNQSYANIEHIIIDGESTDGTLDIIQSHLQRFTDHQFVSEPDTGIYDAMNKGLWRATGDYICFLNSDDLYVNNYVIENVVQEIIEQHYPRMLYGDLWYVDRENTDYVYRYWEAGRYNRLKLLFGWMAPHPTLFIQRELVKKYGYFDTNLTLAADYEMMVRLFFRHRVSAHYLPKILVKMRLGGAGNVDFKSRLKANLEDRKAWLKNGYRSPMIYLTTWFKPTRKIIQFLPYLKKRLLNQPVLPKQKKVFEVPCRTKLNSRFIRREDLA